MTHPSHENRQKQRASARREHGYCYQCLKPPEPGKTYCKEHADAIKSCNTRRSRDRKNLRKCQQCGSPAGKTGLCEAHRRKKNEGIKRNRTNRIGRGLCIDCDSPAVNGKRCNHHHESRVKIRRTTGRFALAKASAKGKGLKWTLERDEYYESIASPCFYCDMENDTKFGIGLDRLDNKHGYEKSNIVSCCGMCNKIRNDHLSVSEMRRVGEIIKQIKIERLPRYHEHRTRAEGDEP